MYIQSTNTNFTANNIEIESASQRSLLQPCCLLSFLERVEVPTHRYQLHMFQIPSFLPQVPDMAPLQVVWQYLTTLLPVIHKICTGFLPFIAPPLLAMSNVGTGYRTYVTTDILMCLCCYLHVHSSQGSHHLVIVQDPCHPYSGANLCTGFKSQAV